MPKAQAQGGHAGAGGGLAHHDADEVVGEQQPPNFLIDALGSLAPQRFGPVERVGLQLIEGEFEFPALVVEGGEFGGRVDRGVEQRGEEHVGAEPR